MRLALVTVLTAGAILTAPAAGAVSDGCAALGGVVEVRGVCHVQAETPVYTLDVKFPVDYSDEQAIVDYLTQTRDGFLNLAQTPGARNLPYELDVTAETFRSERTRSVVLSLFENVGGAHPTNWYKAFNFDVDKNRALTFDTVFAPGILDQVFPLVQQGLETQTGLITSIAAADGMDPSRYQDFAITDNSVIFFFGRGELAPSYYNAVSVTIPRDAISPLLI